MGCCGQWRCCLVVVKRRLLAGGWLLGREIETEEREKQGNSGEGLGVL